MDFQILDGAAVIRSGKADLKDNPDGINLFYVSGNISEPIDAAVFSGKTLVIFLDPDNKLTLNEYTSQVYVDLYKKESFEVK